MDEPGVFPQFAGALKTGVILAVALHVLAIVPQWRANYFNPRFLNVSLYGLMLAVAHAAVIALAGDELPAFDPQHRGSTVGWCLAAALVLNLAVAAQNLLAVFALARLHRRSAVIAHGVRGAVQPLVWTSAALALFAYGAVYGCL